MLKLLKIYASIMNVKATETPVISTITGVCYIWKNTENAI